MRHNTSLYKLLESKKAGLLFILLISISIRLLYFLHFKENPFFYFIHVTSDAMNFDIGAQNFASGDILASSANNSYSPLYKYFLGFIYLMAGRNLPVVWGIQFAMGIFSVLLVFLITEKLFNNRAAFFSALLYTFYGPELMYEGILLRASFITFLGLLSLYLLIMLKEKDNLFLLVITGLAISLFIQSRPNVIVVFFLMFFIPPWSFDKKSLIKLCKLSLVVFVFFIPLLVQGFLMHGKFVFFDSSGPTTILVGNNPNFIGFGWDIKIVNSVDRVVSLSGALSILFRDIISYPVDMATLYFRKIYFFFNSYEFASNYNFYIFQEFSYLLRTPLCNFAFFSSLGLMGFLMNIKNFKKLRLINAYILGMTLSVVLIYVVGRFRIPAVPYFAMFAGSFLDSSCSWLALKKHKELFISAIVFFTLMFSFNTFPDASKTNASNDYGNLGGAYLNTGMIEKSIEAFKKSVKIDPGNYHSHNNLGKIYAEQGDISNAIVELKLAISQNTGRWEAYYNLAHAYLRTGKIKDGEIMLLTAADIAPGEKKILFSLGHLYEDINLLDESLKSYKKYLLLDEKNWKGYFYVGNVLSRKGDLGKAILYYNKSKEIYPNHFGIRLNLGNAYSMMNRPVLAIKEYLQALSLDQKNPDIHRNMGLIYSKKKLYDPRKAVYHFRKTLELDRTQNSAESIKKLISQLSKPR